MVKPKEDERAFFMQVALETLAVSGWEDNPKDKNRTMANMQLTAMAYIEDRLRWMDSWPIYVENDQDPNSLVGIEQVFDVVVTYGDGKKIRYIGTVDGLVWNKKKKVWAVEDNKTANRLSDAWRMMWDMSHQITGYCLISRVAFTFPVYHSHVIGVKLPPTQTEDTYPLEPIARDEGSFVVWGRWLRHTVEMYEAYENDFELAPRYTHSCSRYFRPCSLLTFCMDNVEGRQQQWDEMEASDRSPSERAVMEG